MKFFSLVSIALLVLLAGCVPPATPVPTTTPAGTPLSEIVSPTGYRPLQPGDLVEGATINYHYILPSLEQPVVVVAFGQNLMQLVTVKPELSAGLVAYVQDLAQEPQSIYAFDEADPAQSEPKLLTWDASKPLEIAFIPIVEGQHNWSVTESQENEIRAAYKLVRRQDCGLRFVDAYDPLSLNSFIIVTTRNGSGAGLVFSARLALLKLILTDATYQRGADVLLTQPPQTGQYDPRILKLDPARTGLDQNLDWALVSRPGPNPGIIAP